MEQVDMRSVFGADRLGRAIPEAKGKRDKLVGIFYFVCNTMNNFEEPRDVSRIIAEDPTAATDMDHPAWNGSAYWGEPLFGYYFTDDEWVIRKHIEMLSFADVDFLVRTAAVHDGFRRYGERALRPHLRAGVLRKNLVPHEWQAAHHR